MSLHRLDSCGTLGRILSRLIRSQITLGVILVTHHQVSCRLLFVWRSDVLT